MPDEEPRASQRHAPLLVSIWDDPDFCALPATAQRLYMFLMSQKKTSMVGLLPYTPRSWAKKAADTTIATLDEDLTVLTDTRYVLVDEHTDELLIRTRVKHDPPRGFKSIIAMWRSWELIESARLRKAVLEAVPAHAWDDERAPAPPAARALLETPSDEPQRHRDGNHQVNAPSDAPSEGASSSRARTRGPAATLPPTTRPPATQPPTTSHPAIAAAPRNGSPIAPVHTTQPATPARDRDELFDSLADACGMDYAEMTRVQRRACGVARAELANVEATPSEVRRRAAIYRATFPGAALTPNALAKHWAQLRAPAPNAPTLSRGMQAHIETGRRLGIVPSTPPGASA